MPGTEAGCCRATVPTARFVAKFGNTNDNASKAAQSFLYCLR